MNFVLDASVTVAWAFEDERGPYALSVLDALVDSEAMAASIWPLEVSNALVVAERRRRIEPADASRFAHLILTLPIVVEPVDRVRALDTTWRTARRNELSTYDAAYLDLAASYGLPLATLDGRLRAAAEAEGVGVFMP